MMPLLLLSIFKRKTEDEKLYEKLQKASDKIIDAIVKLKSANKMQSSLAVNNTKKILNPKLSPEQKEIASKAKNQADNNYTKNIEDLKKLALIKDQIAESMKQFNRVATDSGTARAQRAKYLLKKSEDLLSSMSQITNKAERKLKL